jgi:hypothetical protein
MTPEQSDEADPRVGGVLSALPRTRPQRASARRSAKRTGTRQSASSERKDAKSETTEAASNRAPAERKVQRLRTAAKRGTGATPKAAARPATRSKGTAKPGATPKAAARPATRSKGTAKAKQPTGHAPTTKAATTAKPPTRRAATLRAKAPSRAKQAEPPTPRQGYEPEEEVELGKTVNPPSGSELIESLADVFGELANAGATAGARALKDALSIFRRP